MTNSSGSKALDNILGSKGYPGGTIVSLQNRDTTSTLSVGTTLLTHLAIRAVQDKGGLAAYLDTRFEFDPQYARSLGIDLGKLLVSQPNGGAEVRGVLDILLRTGADLIVLDSVVSLAVTGIPTIPGAQTSTLFQKYVAALQQTTLLCVNIPYRDYKILKYVASIILATHVSADTVKVDVLKDRFQTSQVEVLSSVEIPLIPEP